jgi:hypothetical protein
MDMELLEQVLLWILIPLLLIILLLFLVGSYRIYICNDLPKRTHNLDFNSMNTGDILGVGYTHPFGWFVKAWSCSNWSHTGIVWRSPDDGQLYVLEAAIYGDVYSGVIKIPIVSWLRFNRKSHIGISRLKGKPIDPIALINAFEVRKKYVKLESYNWKWYRLLLKKPFFEETRSMYTCYEIVVSVLQDVGVVSKKYACSSYFPCDIMSGNIDLCKGYNIEPAMLLDTDKHTQLRRIEDRSKPRTGTCMKFLGSWSYD